MWKPLEIERWISSRVSTLGDVIESVREIIKKVSEEGDRAILELTERYDGVVLEHIAVSDEEIEAAYESVDDEILEKLDEAADRIFTFHEMQRPHDLWMREVEPGIELGMKFTPLSRVGIYVPGGRASYPTSVLMGAIPARVAGVDEVVCCTPPPVSDVTLVAMDMADVDEAFKVGGAQAVAAMALGTESILPVDKIVGPGNQYVTAAKMILREVVAIDFPAGPSEIAVIADSTADPRFIAADMIAQLEHDPNAAAVLVTDDSSLASKVGTEIERQLNDAPRAEIVREALGHSGYVVVNDVQEAVEITDMIAPEHLSIQTLEPMSVMRSLRNAGAVFIGPYSAVAAGDYASGSNHILPTGGYPRVYSGLDVLHFMRRSSVQRLSREGLDSIGDTIERLAEIEGFDGHRRSVSMRRR